MSNSKRWADGSEAADEMVPVDGFFADGNTVRGRNTNAPNDSSKGAAQKGQQDSPADLAQAFWGAPDAFPLDVRNSHAAPPVWSMAPDSQFGGNSSSADAAPGPMDGQHPDPFFGAHGAFQTRPEQGAGEAAPGVEDGATRASEAGRSDGPTPFDPFLGSPFGAPMGASGGGDFFPGSSSVDRPEEGAVQTQPGADEAPAVGDAALHGLGQAGASLWGPSFSDPSADLGLGAPEDSEFGHHRGDDGLPPPPTHDEMGAEILPWPGRQAPTPIDAPIPVMSSNPVSDFLNDTAERASAPTPAFDTGGGPDLLAEAVESALRNVYGDDLGDDDLTPEQGSYMAERGLLRETPSMQDASPTMMSLRDMYGEDAQGQRAADDSEGAEDWFGGRLDHQPATFVAEPTTEAATEAVLHYLYGRREGGDPTDGYNTTPQSDPYDEHSQGRHTAPSFASRRAGDPTSYEEPYPSGRTEPSFRSHSMEANDLRWDQSQHRTAPTTSRSLARIEPNTTSLPPAADIAEDFGDKDSGRLLGVAGLSLIGGIAVGGIVAAIAFNFFVSDNGGDPMVDPMAMSPTGSVKQDMAFNTPAAPQTFDPSGGDAAPAMAPEGAARGFRGVKPDAAPGKSRSDSRAGGPVGSEERLPLMPASTLSPAKLQAKSVGPITVSDASGSAPGPISISLSIAPSAPAEAALVSIKGLPDQAKLSGGIDVGGGRWLLPPQKVEGLVLTVPAGISGDFKLEAQLMASDVRTAVSDPTPFTVSIAGDGSAPVAPPVYQPPSPDEERGAGRRSESQENRDLLQDGNKLMREGDILNARKFYEKVAASGSAEGALAMGRSYDPSYYENLPVKTGKPDPAQAFEWYKKALDGGLDTARVKIDNLKQWLLR